MSLLATRLLGQVVPTAPSRPHGHGTGAATPGTAPVSDMTAGGGGEVGSPHLLLVAPNVLAVRRQMDLDMA